MGMASGLVVLGQIVFAEIALKVAPDKVHMFRVILGVFVSLWVDITLCAVTARCHCHLIQVL